MADDHSRPEGIANPLEETGLGLAGIANLLEESGLGLAGIANPLEETELLEGWGCKLGVDCAQEASVWLICRMVWEEKPFGLSHSKRRLSGDGSWRRAAMESS